MNISVDTHIEKAQRELEQAQHDFEQAQEGRSTLNKLLAKSQAEFDASVQDWSNVHTLG